LPRDSCSFNQSVEAQERGRKRASDEASRADTSAHACSIGRAPHRPFRNVSNYLLPLGRQESHAPLIQMNMFWIAMTMVILADHDILCQSQRALGRACAAVTSLNAYKKCSRKNSVYHERSPLFFRFLQGFPSKFRKKYISVQPT
jgi:hypothetical protein